MKRSKLLAMLLMLMVSMAIHAQNVVVKGNVKDATGEPVIGASVVQVGNTSVGTVTDFDGNFQLSVPSDSKIQVSYIGFENQTVPARPVVNIILSEDDNTLNDVVVIGYGVQKKSVVTAAIAKVTADDLTATAPVRMDNALKGLAAGVNVTNSSGAPGAGSKVRIRGIGTINNSDPLYIVDGMPIEGGIDYISPSDIESIEVLKDAASAAVYGARAANGVILVTTKSGKEGKTVVNYNFSQGWQTAWKHRDVLNASEYAVMMNEGRINSGRAPLFDDPYSLGQGTDWQSEIFNDNAPVSQHEVNVSGASDNVNYYLSLNSYSQDGIVGGDYDRSNYRRMTLRSNTKYTVFDHTAERGWLNKLQLTSNISYSKIRSVGVSENGNSHGILNSALTMAPVLPVAYYGSEADAMLAQYMGMTNYVPQYTADGGLFMVPGIDYDNQMNPIAYLNVPCLGSWGWSHKFVANFAADLDLGWGFKWRTSYGVDLGFWGGESYTDEYYLTSAMNWGGKTGASASSSRGTVWQLENVLTWDKEFGKHGFNVVLGQSAKKSTGYAVSASKNLLVDVTKPYVSYATGVEKGDVGASARPSDVATLASMFARLSYNYDERYMLQVTVRRDGSSRFGANNHYAIFPSASLGWNVHNEKFMAATSNWLSKFKIRASWGKNGNEAIENYRYAANTSYVGHYDAIFGRGEGNQAVGNRAGGLANPDLKWEESEQTDLGIDFGFFNSALTFSVDYFIKKTNGMLMTMPIPSYVGLAKPWGNVGDMKNSGLEFELGYKGSVGSFHYSIKGNAAYLKNELINLGNETGTADLDNIISIGTITRAMNGLPYPYFYGYKTDGVFQNPAEVDAYNAQYPVNNVNSHVQPGDLRIVDADGDGQITDSDKTMIGKGTPDWTFGFNVSAEWKGFDLSMFWQGTQGNDIYDATIRVDKENQNLPSWMLGRWTGEGTSNRIPRYVLGASSNTVSSDLYVYDGSYLRLKNIQLGYTIPSKWTKKAYIERLRVYGMAENLFTFTKYHGYDPEISSGGRSLGVDYGVYPQARTLTVGVNLTFGMPSKKKAEPVYSTPKVEYVDRVVEKPVEKVVTKEVETTKAVEKTYVATFAVNSANIADATELNGIEKGATVDVVAYASPEGNAEANKALSQKRADAVADYLKARGINVNRVEAKGANTDHANRIAIVTVK